MLTTRTITHTRPKPVPLAGLISQNPLCVPRVVGAVIGIRISTVAPGAVSGTGTLVTVAMDSPLTKVKV